jgi:hypothetical protein
VPQNIIERAFQLARSGECRTLGEIHQRLRREQYSQTSEHLSGRLIKAQLSKLMEQARGRGMTADERLEMGETE